MIALAASLLVFFYLITPLGLFRVVFGRFVPLRNFDETRKEEVFHAALNLLLPFFFAWGLVWFVTPFSDLPFPFPDTLELRAEDYKLVFACLYSEDRFTEHEAKFWPSLGRVAQRQVRLLFWYHSVVFVTGSVYGVLASRYYTLQKLPLYTAFANYWLIPNISEWHLLLTPFLFPDKNLTVKADILSDDGRLYRGKISGHYLDKEGKLSGLILTEAQRFRRDAYLKELEKGLATEQHREKYWRTIPGARLYFFAERILNLNLRHEFPLGPELLVRLLKEKLNMSVTAEYKPPAKK